MVLRLGGLTAGAEDGINIGRARDPSGYGQRRGRFRARRRLGWRLSPMKAPAYWIAHAGAECVLAHERRTTAERAPAATASSHESLKLQTDLDLCAQVYGANARSRGELAQFSLLVSKAADWVIGPPSISFRRAGQELAADRRSVAAEAGL
jgi:hypothetical protein